MVQAGNTILPPLMRVSSLYKGGNSQPRLSAIHPFNFSTIQPFNKIDPSPDTTCHPQPFGIQSHKVHSSPVRTSIPQGERNIIPSLFTLRLFNQNYPSPALRAPSPARGEGTIIFTPSTFQPFNKIDPSPDTTCHPQPFGIQSHKVHSSPVRTSIPQRGEEYNPLTSIPQRGEEYNPLTPHPSPIQPKLPLTRPSGTLSRKGRGDNTLHTLLN